MGGLPAVQAVFCGTAKFSVPSLEEACVIHSGTRERADYPRPNPPGFPGESGESGQNRPAMGRPSARQIRLAGGNRPVRSANQLLI